MKKLTGKDAAAIAFCLAACGETLRACAALPVLALIVVLTLAVGYAGACLAGSVLRRTVRAYGMK